MSRQREPGATAGRSGRRGGRIAAALWGICLGLAGLLALLLWRPWAGGEAEGEPGRRCTPQHPCLVLVVDDVGRDRQTLGRWLALDLPLTFSVLPHARHTAASLADLRRAEAEVLLHLPMRPRDLSQITDEPLVVGLDGAPAATVKLCLNAVPGAVGVNNHMGSALSRDPAMLAEVVGATAGRGLFWLDSRTVAGSRICPVARGLGMACVDRDIFLDDPPDRAAVLSALARAVELARARGWAVVVGHNTQQTVDTVAPELVTLRKTLVTLSTLVMAGSRRSGGKSED